MIPENIACPYCQKKIDLPATIKSRELVEIIKLQSVFGRHCRLVFEYLELFGVVPLAKKSAKLLRLLEGMSELWQSGRFAFSRRQYQISRNGIVSSLQVVTNKIFSSNLENHNYLKKVMIDIAGKEENQKSREDDIKLRKKEEDLSRGIRPKDVRVNQKKVRELIEGIG